MKGSDLLALVCMTSGSPLDVKSLFLKWKHLYQWTDSDIRQIEIPLMDRQWSLYWSFLSLINLQHHLVLRYMDKTEMIDNFVRFLLAQLTINNRVRSFLKEVKKRPNDLVKEIKNDSYQSSQVVAYLSLVFDLNLCILSCNHVELYYSDETYDCCKPHLLMYRDTHQVYHPLTMDEDTSIHPFLIYHDHHIVRSLVGSPNKKVICKKNIFNDNRRK